MNSRTSLEALRRRRKRVLIALIVFVLLMPVGCVGPFSLFSVVPKDFQTPLFISALVLPLVGLAGTLLMLGDRSKLRRAVALAEQADQLGVGFTERPAPTEYEWLAGTESYGAAEKHLGAANLLAGRVNGLDVWVIDYTCAVGGTGWRQTVFVIRGVVAGTPDLVVTPRGWLDQIGRLFGDRGIEVPGRPKFSAQFIAAGADSTAVADCLSGPAGEWLERAQDMTIEVRDGTLIAQRYKQLARPDDYANAIGRLVELADAIKRGR